MTPRLVNPKSTSDYPVNIDGVELWESLTMRLALISWDGTMSDSRFGPKNVTSMKLKTVCAQRRALHPQIKWLDRRSRVATRIYIGQLLTTIWHTRLQKWVLLSCSMTFKSTLIANFLDGSMFWESKEARWIPLSPVASIRTKFTWKVQFRYWENARHLTFTVFVPEKYPSKTWNAWTKQINWRKTVLRSLLLCRTWINLWQR